MLTSEQTQKFILWFNTTASLAEVSRMIRKLNGSCEVLIIGKQVAVPHITTQSSYSAVDTEKHKMVRTHRSRPEQTWPDEAHR
jgi:hypothetical protein